MIFGVSWWLVGVAAVAAVAMLVAILNHKPRPVQFTDIHVAIGAFSVGMLLGGVIYVSHLNRVGLENQREERLRENTAFVKRLIRLEAPTTAELARRSRQALRVCARTAECRREFTSTVRQVLTVTKGRIVSAPPRRRERPRPVQTPRPVTPAPRPRPAPVPSTRPGVSRPDPRVSEALQRVAALERELDALKARHPVDSSTVDRIDNTVRELERAVGELGARVNGLLAGLCTPSLAKLLNLLRICG